MPIGFAFGKEYLKKNNATPCHNKNGLHASCDSFPHGPVGLMDKASASGAGDSRLESWAGHNFGGPHALNKVDVKEKQGTLHKLCWELGGFLIKSKAEH